MGRVGMERDDNEIVFEYLTEASFVNGEWGWLIPFVTVMNSVFLTFSCIIEGASKKLLQVWMPPEPIYNKKFCSNEQKWLL